MSTLFIVKFNYDAKPQILENVRSLRMRDNETLRIHQTDGVARFDLSRVTNMRILKPIEGRTKTPTEGRTEMPAG